MDVQLARQGLIPSIPGKSHEANLIALKPAVTHPGELALEMGRRFKVIGYRWFLSRLESYPLGLETFPGIYIRQHESQQVRLQKRPDLILALQRLDCGGGLSEVSRRAHTVQARGLGDHPTPTRALDAQLPPGPRFGFCPSRCDAPARTRPVQLPPGPKVLNLSWGHLSLLEGSVAALRGRGGEGAGEWGAGRGGRGGGGGSPSLPRGLGACESRPPEGLTAKYKSSWEATASRVPSARAERWPEPRRAPRPRWGSITRSPGASQQPGPPHRPHPGARAWLEAAAVAPARRQEHGAEDAERRRRRRGALAAGVGLAADAVGRAPATTDRTASLLAARRSTPPASDPEWRPRARAALPSAPAPSVGRPRRLPENFPGAAHPGGRRR